jgi:hypothetical protein
MQGLFGWRGMGETQREEWSAAVRAVLSEPAVQGGDKPGQWSGSLVLTRAE